MTPLPVAFLYLPFTPGIVPAFPAAPKLSYSRKKEREVRNAKSKAALNSARTESK